VVNFLTDNANVPDTTRRQYHHERGSRPVLRGWTPPLYRVSTPRPPRSPASLATIRPIRDVLPTKPPGRSQPPARWSAKTRSAPTCTLNPGRHRHQSGMACQWPPGSLTTPPGGTRSRRLRQRPGQPAQGPRQPVLALPASSQPRCIRSADNLCPGYRIAAGSRHPTDQRTHAWPHPKGPAPENREQNARGFPKYVQDVREGSGAGLCGVRRRRAGRVRACRSCRWR
jgi:hypothetical protein